MEIPKVLACVIVLLFLHSSVASRINPTASQMSAPTVYDVLEKYGFPKGILPVGVTGYLLREDGTFEVYLGNRLGDCTFPVTGYNLSYKRQITGKLDQGVITNLKGVSVKVLFVWLGITEVSVSDDGDELNFFVGPLSASFTVDNFEDCPRCGCGFDCGGRRAEQVATALDS